MSDRAESAEGEHQGVPQAVRLELNLEALEKNLDEEGFHHVFGKDGTHVIIRDSEGEPSTAKSEPRIQLKRNEEETKGVLRRLFG